MTLSTLFSTRSRLACGAFIGLALAGCASTPPPTALMARAQQQIQAAEAAQAADFAPVDLGFARKRYQSAQAAMNTQKYDLAQDMANESIADSRLAQARAKLAAVRRQIKAQRAENARLREQLLSGPATPASSAADNAAPSGLPSQIVLPQPAPPASSMPAPPASSPLPAAGAR